MKKAVERPPFRTWLADRLARYAMKKAFKEEREPQSADERDEISDIIRGIWQRCWALSYVPQLKQDLFHRARISQVRGMWAPNQRGKTTAGEIELLSWGFGEDLWTGKPIEKIGKTKWRPGMRFFIGAKDYAAGIGEVILPKMEELLPLEAMGVEYIKMSGRIVHKLKFPEPYSFSIKMMSYEQDTNKNEGMTWNGGWFDEPPPKHLYITCRRGCLRHAAPLIFTGTPIEEPWMYEDIFAHRNAVHIEKEEDLKHLKWSSHAIVKVRHDEYPPGVTKEQIEAWSETMDEEEKLARVYGEFIHLQGRVYKQFDRAKHVLDRDEFFSKRPNWREWPAFCVMDPHDRKPFAIAWGVITPRDEIVFIDEWPKLDFFKQKSWRWSIDDYANMIRENEKALWGDAMDPITWRIMDPNFGRTQKAGTGRTLEEEFAERGMFFDTTVDDNIEDGHMVVRSDLHNERLFVLSHMNNMIRSAENYVWDEFRGKSDRAVKERPKDKFKDFMDLWRYTCKSELHYISRAQHAVQRNPWT